MSVPDPDDKRNWIYLGDAVYAYWDGFGLWLVTGAHDNPDQRIYMEPSVINGMNDFYKQKKERRIK